jgi:hypothetical protein
MWSMFMTLRDAALSLAIALCLAAPLSAQESAPAQTRSADLVLMRGKARADPMLRDQFQQVEEAFSRKNSNLRRVNLHQYLFRIFGGTEVSLNEPVRIATIGGLRPAKSRASAVGQILAADLDGDWQITRDELTETLKYDRTEAAASVFLTGDKDRNDVLTFEEIKAAVEGLVTPFFSVEQQATALMTVFDFDNDGNLSQTEVDRGTAALTQ